MSGSITVSRCKCIARSAVSRILRCSVLKALMLVHRSALVSMFVSVCIAYSNRVSLLDLVPPSYVFHRGVVIVDNVALILHLDR